MKYFLLIFIYTNLIASEGLTSFNSKYRFEDTNQKIEKFLKNKNLNIFAIIDHSKNAKDAGLSLSATKLFIFGNQKVGTPLMKASPTFGLDLPVKVLVHKSKNNRVIISFTKPKHLAEKHGVSIVHESIKKMTKILDLIKSEFENNSITE